MSPNSAHTESQLSAHITAQSLLLPTLRAWQIYLEDQANSPHTVKAFIADLRLLAIAPGSRSHTRQYFDQ